MKRTNDVQITNLMGMHARPAAEFVKLAGSFSASIHVSKDEVSVNGKSIMGVLMLAAEHGSTLTISAEGTDADEAIAALTALVTGGFGELAEGDGHLTTDD